MEHHHYNDHSFDSLDERFFDRAHEFAAVPLSTISQVHRTKEAFTSKRLMELSIYADIFLVTLNFHKWIQLKDGVDYQVNIEAANKLEFMFLICFLPFILIKVLIRVWPYRTPSLQFKRCVFANNVQFTLCFFYLVINRTNCLPFSFFGGVNSRTTTANPICLTLIPDNLDRNIFYLAFSFIDIILAFFYAIAGISSLGVVCCAIFQPK